MYNLFSIKHLATLAVPSGLKAKLLSFLSLNSYISLDTTSLVSPEVLLNNSVASKTGVLIKE